MRQLLGVLRLGVGLVLALAAAVPGHAAGRFEADDFRYLGAFRLPVCNQPIEGSTTDVLSWVTKGVETYYPAGDPAGPPDGFTGSLYGIGHAWVTRMFEINIPAPVISKNISDLPVAALLQTPTDVAGPIEISGDGLKAIDYLTQQSGMDGDKLHIAVGQHYQYDPRPTHGWTNLTMDPASTVGPWYVGYEN